MNEQDLLSRLYPDNAPQGNESPGAEKPRKSTHGEGDIVQRLYPDDRPSSTEDAEEPPPGEQKDILDQIYPEKPERTGNPYALDSGSLEDKLYGGSQKVNLRGDTDLSLISPVEAEQAGLADNIGFMAHEVGATQDDVHGIVQYLNQALLTGETFDPQESLRSLYDEHGRNLVNRLEDAQLLVQSLDPDLIEWLESTRLGDSPVLVNFFIRLSQTPRGRERLNILKGRKS